MGCPHALWERNATVEADGLCPICLKSMLDLSDRRLADSERLRTKLAALVNDLQQRLAENSTKERKL